MTVFTSLLIEPSIKVAVLLVDWICELDHRQGVPAQATLLSDVNALDVRVLDNWTTVELNVPPGQLNVR